MRQAILTDPLKFWVMTRTRFPENVTGLRYQISETEASMAAFVDVFVLFAVVSSLVVSVVVDMVAAEVAVMVGVLDSGSVRGLEFKSGL